MIFAASILSAFLIFQNSNAFKSVRTTRRLISMSSVTSTFEPFKMANKDKSPAEPEKEGWERLKQALENAENDPKKRKGPPIYEPGPYPYRALAALAYVVPIVDAMDLGKYMFEAYPATLVTYNSLYGPLASVYNGVPFLSFAVFFLMSYICRAPTFPVEIRFHFSQAFMLSIIQFVPSLLFGLLEKGGVPGMGVLYNTAFLWVMISSLVMQVLLLNPLSSSKNPILLNVANWSLKYMGYTPDMAPRK